MKLKAVYDAQADIPESLRDYYVDNKAGKFVLDADVKATDDFKAIWGEVLELRKAKEEMGNQLSVFGDLTPDSVRGMQDKLKELEAASTQTKDPGEIKRLAEEIVAQRTKGYLKEIEEHKNTLSALSQERDAYKEKLTTNDLVERLRKVTEGKIKPGNFVDVINRARLAKLKYDEASDNFVHEESAMTLQEWFGKELEDSAWAPESKGGGAAGGRGGAGGGQLDMLGVIKSIGTWSR